MGSFTKVPTVLQHYQQQTAAHHSSLSKSKAKEYNKSDSISRNPPSSMVLDMQETIPLDQMHLQKSNLAGRRPDGDLHETTIWNNAEKY